MPRVVPSGLVAGSTEFKRRCRVSGARNARPVNVTRRASRPPVDRRAHSVVVHRHANGRVVVAFNAVGERVDAWSDRAAYSQLRCRSCDDPRALLVDTLRPRVVYINDGTGILPLDDATVDVRRVDTLAEALALCEGKNTSQSPARRSSSSPSPSPSPPTYEEILELDGDISREDYEAIYRPIAVATATVTAVDDVGAADAADTTNPRYRRRNRRRRRRNRRSDSNP